MHIQRKYIFTKLKAWCTSLSYDGSVGIYSGDMERISSVGCIQCPCCGCSNIERLLIHEAFFSIMINHGIFVKKNFISIVYVPVMPIKVNIYFICTRYSYIIQCSIYEYTPSTNIFHKRILLDTRSIHTTDIVSNRPYGCALFPRKMLLFFFSCLTSILGCCSTIARAIQLNDKYMLTKLKSWCSSRVLMFDGSFGTYSWGIEQTDSVDCSQCQSCGYAISIYFLF